jgi:hypothetical protein
MGILEMMDLRFVVQRENIIDHTNGKCHMFTFYYAR